MAIIYDIRLFFTKLFNMTYFLIVRVIILDMVYLLQLPALGISSEPAYSNYMISDILYLFLHWDLICNFFRSWYYLNFLFFLFTLNLLKYFMKILANIFGTLVFFRYFLLIYWDLNIFWYKTYSSQNYLIFRNISISSRHYPLILN